MGWQVNRPSRAIAAFSEGTIVHLILQRNMKVCAAQDFCIPQLHYWKPVL
jgi:hypothetical protein